MSLKYVLLVLAVLAVLGMVFFAVRSMLSVPPEHLGVKDGRLAECPDRPNCVASQSEKPGHQMEPIPFEGDPEAAWQTVQQVIRDQPRAKIVDVSNDYLHAEFTSLVFRFTDDVELLLDAENRQIDFRSASRVGHSDLGVNRARMQRIRAEFEQALK